MYRSINQLSLAKAKKKNVILTFTLFLILITYLVLSTKPAINNTDLASESETMIKLP